MSQAPLLLTEINNAVPDSLASILHSSDDSTTASTSLLFTNMHRLAHRRDDDESDDDESDNNDNNENNNNNENESGACGSSCSRCNACPHCADVCDNNDCNACREKSTFAATAAASAAAASSSSSKTTSYTLCQVRRHNHAASAWIVAGNVIYDATPYLSGHPGGADCILRRAGGVTDCTADLYFHSRRGRKQWEKRRIGTLRPCAKDENNNNNNNNKKTKECWRWCWCWRWWWCPFWTSSQP
jgi:cytochrome b involved in lipid metabolism